MERGKPLISGSFCTEVLDLGGDRLLKYGNSVCRSEAVAMQYVRERTTIPVPRVFAYTHDPERYNVDREGYLVMEKLPGVALLEKLKDLSARDTTFIATQLKDIVSQLRTLDDTSRWGMIGKNGVFFTEATSHTATHPPFVGHVRLMRLPTSALTFRHRWDPLNARRIK